MRGATASILLCCAGCAQIFGLDETTNTGRTNSVTLRRLSIGKTVVDTPLDLTGLSATYLVSTGDSVARVTAMTDTGSPGIWTVHAPEPVPVEFTLPGTPDPSLQLYTFPSSTLSVPVSVAEHQNPEPVPDPGTLVVTTMLDKPLTADERLQAYTVGSWTSRRFAAGEVTLPMPSDPTMVLVTYDFKTSENLSGRAQFDKLTAEDEFFMLRYAGTTLTGYAEARFNQTGDDPVATFPMIPVETSQTLDVTIDPPTLTSRYAAVLPQMQVSSLTMTWRLIAAPGYQSASRLGPELAAGSLTVTDLGVITKYGNPFTNNPFSLLDWKTVLAVTTSESRTFLLPGATTPIVLSAGMNQFVEPIVGLPLDMPAGLPKLVSINRNQLSVDGQMISIPSEPVDIAFMIDNLNAKFYSLQISDLVANEAGTDVVRSQVLFAAAAEARFLVPPETFKAGHNYVLRASCTFQGYPEVGSGDFVTRELPMTEAFLDSAVFTVMP